jgi:hypothetical protein
MVRNNPQDTGNTGRRGIFAEKNGRLPIINLLARPTAVFVKAGGDDSRLIRSGLCKDN